MPYIGPVRVTGPRGDRALVHAELEWINDEGDWAGVLTAVPPHLIDAGDLIIELPSNRWWDLPFVSRVEIDLATGGELRVHGSAPGPGVLHRLELRRTHRAS